MNLLWLSQPLFSSLTWSRIRRSRNPRIDVSDALIGALAPHEDITIVGVSNEPQPTSREFGVQFVKDDVGQQWREDALNAKGNFGLLADQIGMAASSGRFVGG